MAAKRPETQTGGRAATTCHISGDYALAVGMPKTPPPPRWKWTKLTDVARLETGHTPSRKHPEYWGGDVPWIGIRDATANHGQTLSDTNQHTNELGINNSSARVLPENTVCLSRTASVGYVVVMGRPMATSQDFVNWVCSEQLDHRFLKYVLLAENRSFLRFASGTTHQTIYFPEVKAFHICLPPVPEQKAIAHILGTLDDKIELNRRMNGTLEAMARVIFKSWFVDFDPVRAKMDGRQPPGMDAETAALFPDSLEHRNGDLIPAGWSLTRLGDEVDVFTGFPFKSRDYTDSPGSIRLVRGDNVIQGRLRWQNVKRWPTDLLDGLDDYELQSGDVVLAMDRPWIEAGLKYAWIADHDLPCLLVQRVARLRANETPIGRAFTRLMIGTPQFTQHVLAVQTGTAVPHISAKQISSFEFVVPTSKDRHLLQRFETTVSPLLDRFDANNAESETLAAIRATLLPKLLSGEMSAQEVVRNG